MARAGGESESVTEGEVKNIYDPSEGERVLTDAFKFWSRIDFIHGKTLKEMNETENIQDIIGLSLVNEI